MLNIILIFSGYMKGTNIIRASCNNLSFDSVFVFIKLQKYTEIKHSQK